MQRFVLKLFRRKSLEKDLEMELAFHREMASAHGNSIPLGNSTILKEQARDLWRFNWFENLCRDFRYAVRGLARNPGLVFSALLSLGLGIGANTAIFSLAVEFLFVAPSVSDPGSLVSVRAGGSSHAGKEVVEFIRASGLFQEVVGTNDEAFANWDSGTDTRRIFAAQTTRNYFSMLGIPVAVGRRYVPDDPDEVVVLSHEFWVNQFGADPAIIGRGMRLDGRAYTVIGILPENHRTLLGFGYSPDVFMPSYREDIVLAMYARLKPGMSAGEAQAGLAAVGQRLDRAFPAPFRYADACSVRPVAGMAHLNSNKMPVGVFFVVLLVLVGLVLLIACVNVASLLLARASARRQELAIRLSLGASRSRLLQQMLVESLLLAVLGALFGLALRQAIAAAIEQVRLPVPIPIRLHLDFDWRIALYAAALTGFATVACGLLPAIQSVRQSISSNLRKAGRMRLRRGLVIAQIALSLIVLTTGFLFVRNLWKATAISPGFDVRNTLRAEVHLEPASYKEEARKRAYAGEALARLAAIPGIEAVAAARIVPFTDSVRNRASLRFSETGEQVEVRIQWNAVSPDYFRTMGIPILSGRSFSITDRGDSTRSVIVNRTFVNQYLKGSHAVGREFTWDHSKQRSVIIGVVEGTKNNTIGEDDRPQLYEHIAQVSSDRTRMQFVLRSSVPPALQLDAVRDTLRRIDPSAGLEVATLFSSIGLAFFPSQVGAALFGSIGVLGLVLAMIGLYGVMVYSVTRRTQEIGLRMAIGAHASEITRMILRDGVRLIGTGAAIGLVIAFFVTKPLAMFLVPGIQPADPVSFGGVIVVFAAVGVLASWVPARRAAAMDPMSCLRHE